MKVGPYSILSEVGRGGMGVVYRARALDGRTVAVKLLLSTSRMSTAFDRFERERRLLAALGEAEGFVPLLDHGLQAGQPYLVMPFVGGGTLRARLQERETLGTQETLDLGVQLAAALGRAHEKGLVHRDLKPENVLFTDDGRALVADLGLAKHFREDVAGASASVSLSKTGEALGTAGYMPQEQLNDAKSAGPAADVFALGAILYECLTGVPAFEGDTAQERVVKSIEGRVKPVRSHRADVPRGLAQVVEQSLAGRPEDRYADGAAFSRALLDASRRPEGTPRRGGGLKIAAAVVVGGGLVGLLLLASFTEKIEPKHGADPAKPPPVHGETPRPKREIPAVCSGFREGARMKLASVLGEYAFKHAGAVQAVAFSPDGKLAATGGDDCVVRLWDVATASEVRLLAGHEGAVIGLDFSPTGDRVISAGTDASVRIFEVATGTTLLAIKGFPHHVWCAVFSPDGERFLTACRDGKVRLHDVKENGKILRELAGPPGIIPSCSFSPDGSLGAFVAGDGVRIFDLATGELRRHYREHTAGVDWPAWTPDGFAILSGGWDTTMRLWKVQTGETVRTYTGHTDNIRCGVVTRDGKRAFTCSKDQTVRLWDLPAGRELWQRGGHRGWILSCAVTRDGRRGLSGGSDGTCRLWDLDALDGRDLTPAGHQGAVTAVAITPDGHHAITGGADGTVRAWDLRDESGASRALGGHAAALVAVAVAEDGERVLSVSADGVLKLWGRTRGNLIWSDEGGPAVTCATFASDGRRALAGTESGQLVGWDLDAGSRSLLGFFASTIFAVAFAKDGAPMSAAADHTIRIWDRAGTSVRDVVQLEEDDDVSAVAFAPDEKSALVGGERTLRVKELRATSSARELAKKGAVSVLAVSPDGRRAVAAGPEGRLTLWDLDASRSVETLELATSADSVSAAVFGPGGKSVLVATRRGVVLRFELR